MLQGSAHCPRALISAFDCRDPIPFQSPQRIRIPLASRRADLLAPVAVLRSRLASCFAARIANPRAPLPPLYSGLLDTLCSCFAAEAANSSYGQSPGGGGDPPGAGFA